VKIVYVIERVEYERGWGSRISGYLTFRTEAEALKYSMEAMKDRELPVPDYYVNYDYIGPKSCTDLFYSRFSRGPIPPVENLKELIEC
jgi:hypothetical protein